MVYKNYQCERCDDPAQMVHHRTHITPENINDPNVTLDWANLESLCMDCHNAEHFGGPVCAEGLRFDRDGNLIPK